MATQDFLAKFTASPPAVDNSIVKEVSGNLGISTTSPAAKLDISGGTSYDTPTLRLAEGEQSIGLGDRGRVLSWPSEGLAGTFLTHNAAHDGAVGWKNLVNAALSMIQAGTGDVRMYTNSSPGAAGTVFTQNERMRIDVSGNVGIGTTSPSAKLHLYNGNGLVDRGNLSVVQESAPGSAPTVVVNVAAGNLNGTYKYRITFVTAAGETIPGPISASVSPANQKVDLTSIPTGTANVVTARKIYRAKLVSSTYTEFKLVTTVNDNSSTSYPDNTADGSLGAAAPDFGTALGIVGGNVHVFPKGQSGQDTNKAPLQLFFDTTGSGASAASTAAGLWANIGVKNQNNNPGAPVAGQRVAEYWYFMSVADDAIDNKGIILYNSTLDLQYANVGGACAEFDIQNVGGPDPAGKYPFEGGSTAGVTIVIANSNNKVNAAFACTRGSTGAANQFRFGYYSSGCADAAFHVDNHTNVDTAGVGPTPSVAFENVTNAAILLKTTGSHATALVDSPYCRIWEDATSIFIGSKITNGAVALATGPSGALTTRVIVDGNGDMSPFANNTYRLGLSGSKWMELYVNGLTVAGASVGIGTTPAVQLHTTGAVRFANFGAGTASFDASGNLSSSSDERLKVIIGHFNRGLEAIRSLSPIRYRWRDDSGNDSVNEYAGFGAAAVKTVIPEAVIGSDARGHLPLNDRPILCALVNAVKELEARLLDLERDRTLVTRSIFESARH